MTDAPDLDGSQEAVRRLLAEARHDAPLPAAVSARLDDTLARLHAEAAAEQSPAPVIDLASRRRRRAATGLLAAAAVVVGGVALGQVLPGSSDDARTTADSFASPLRSADADALAGDAEEGAGLADRDLLKSSVPEASGVPVIELDGDLTQTLTQLRIQSDYAALTRPPADRARCVGGPIGPGRRVDVQVDQEPGLVLYRPRRGSEQVVEIFVCGNPSPVRTLTLPAP